MNDRFLNMCMQTISKYIQTSLHFICGYSTNICWLTHTNKSAQSINTNAAMIRSDHPVEQNSKSSSDMWWMYAILNVNIPHIRVQPWVMVTIMTHGEHGRIANHMAVSSGGDPILVARELHSVGSWQGAQIGSYNRSSWLIHNTLWGLTTVNNGEQWFTMVDIIVKNDW